MLVLKRCLPTPTMNRLLDSTCTRTSVGHCRSCYTLMAHRHIDTESHSRPVARCPARMLRHTADRRPATNHASGNFFPQEPVTWITKRTNRRCCWRNAVKGFSCSRDRSSLSCAPAPRTSNTIPPRSTCMATARPNRPNHSLKSQSESSSNTRWAHEKVGLLLLGADSHFTET